MNSESTILPIPTEAATILAILSTTLSVNLPIVTQAHQKLIKLVSIHMGGGA